METIGCFMSADLKSMHLPILYKNIPASNLKNKKLKKIRLILLGNFLGNAVQIYPLIN